MTQEPKTPIFAFNGKFRFLSNFYPSRVTFAGEVYPTVEHAFQAAKTLSKDERAVIRGAATPGKAKRLGRQVTLRADWEDIKISVMQALLIQKFHDPVLQARLLETHPRKIVEGNTWNDTFWGVCNGKGRNELGKLLMKIRDQILEDG